MTQQITPENIGVTVSDLIKTIDVEVLSKEFDIQYLTVDESNKAIL